MSPLTYGAGPRVGDGDPLQRRVDGRVEEEVGRAQRRRQRAGQVQQTDSGRDAHAGQCHRVERAWDGAGRSGMRLAGGIRSVWAKCVVILRRQNSNVRC